MGALFKDLAQKINPSQIKRLAIDGTSGTVLICDKNANALSSALMYNDDSSNEALKTIRAHCPDKEHLCLNVTSGLAKAVQLISSFELPASYFLASQADYIAGWLAGRSGFTDYHNALKMGYDPIALSWPNWIKNVVPEMALPKVYEPGQVVASIDPARARQFGLSNNLKICAGTTDSNAAFLATGLNHPGDAVTSLGSTLVLKILNEHPVNNLTTGIYSHRLGDYWLVSGASNAGAAILAKFFNIQELEELSKQITLNESTGLDYYPLTRKGERFPSYDPAKKPILTPRPSSDVKFLKALLEGLTSIEQQGYAKLVSMGAHHPKLIWTSGGGAVNDTWRLMRQRNFKIPVKTAAQSEASFGSALLAQSGLKKYRET